MKIQTVAEPLTIADEFFDGMRRRGRSDSQQRHRPFGLVAEWDGLEDSLCVHTIGKASRLAPELHGKLCNKLPDQASSGAVWRGSVFKT